MIEHAVKRKDVYRETRREEAGNSRCDRGLFKYITPGGNHRCDSD